MSFGLIAFDTVGSELTVRLSKEDELFKGNISIGELADMDTEDTDAYLSSLKKKLDYDEEAAKLICKRSFGISGWECVLKKVYLKESDFLVAELTRAHKRIDELETLLSKHMKPLNQGIVRFSYEKGRLSYTFETECDPVLFEKYLLCYFKEVIYDFARKQSSIPEIRSFSREISRTTSFNDLQKAVLDLYMTVPNNMMHSNFRYMPYISDGIISESRPYKMSILWERPFMMNNAFDPSKIRNMTDFTSRFPPLRPGKDSRFPQDGFFSIVKIQFPIEFFAIDAEPPASLTQEAYPLDTYCDIFGNETQDTSTDIFNPRRFLYIF